MVTMKRILICLASALAISLALCALGFAGDGPFEPAPKVIHAGRFAFAPSAVTGSAIWVSECLTPDCLKGNAVRGSFHVDEHLPKEFRASSADYAHSGYAIGHLAPAGDYHEQGAQDATFVFTNAVPQDPTLNSGLWAKIEAEVRALVADDTVIHVVTIPLYRYPRADRVKRLGNVIVPTDLAKAAYLERRGKPHSMLAWLVPNISPAGRTADSFRVSVDAIEAAAELDLFSELDDEVENRLEAIGPREF
jgi:endonuclease G, mitochondrial